MCLFSGQVPLAEEKFVSGGGSFEFQPPDGIPVAIHPMVGFVPYKQVGHCETDSSKFQSRSWKCPRRDLAIKGLFQQHESHFWRQMFRLLE